MERVRGSGHPSTSRESEWVHVFVPKRFADATFDTYEVSHHNQKMFGAVKDWATTYERGAEGLVLGGAIGTGKTHLLYATGRELAKRGIWAVYRNFATFCIEMKDAWREKESGNHLKDMLAGAPILMLDDLGAEMQPKSEQGWVAELVYDIVETRYNEMLPTVIATNLNIEDIKARYTHRVASRLAEMSKLLWVEGYDYRLRGRAGGMCGYLI